MRRYILDTNALSDFINDRRGVRYRAVTARQAGARIGTCYPVLGEYYYGLELSTSRAHNLKLLQAGIARFTIWPFDHPAAREYGRITAQLLRMGRPMQVVDIQLAAIAFALGNCTVVSSDSDLAAVPGLPVENWAAP